MKSLIGLRLARPFCEGYFYPDFQLEDAVVEAVGRDWVVIRLKDGGTSFQAFEGWKRKEIKRKLREWSTPEE